MDLHELITDRVRDVPDHPTPGVVFKDITPLLADPVAFAAVVEAIVAEYRDRGIDKIAGLEARGFLFAAPVAYRFGAGLIPIRKKGKLPAAAYEQSYDLEYGTATIEMHVDAVEPGDRVLLVDDVLATGGTAAAAAGLLRRGGAEVVALSVLMELEFLRGRDLLPGLEVRSLISV